MKFYPLQKFAMLVFTLLASIAAMAQTPGLIYKPASTAFGRSVLDPNGDGFISVSSTGFSGGIDFGAASELSLIPMPIMEGEPHSDLTTGANGGHTDLVSNTDPLQTSYVGVRTVNGVKYLIVRIRLGGASTAAKGYSLLIDTDGLFGNGSGNNPGFEKEVILETGNSGKVAIYNLTAGNNTTTLAHSYNVNEYHQRSVAASTVNGNTDYFYDFFVPFSDLGISTSQMIRFTAATITNSNSGISGTVSDFNGIDDKKYGNNRTLLMNQIINAFPSASLDQLSDPTFTFNPPKTPAPAVNGGIATSSTTISGTSVEADNTSIQVFKNGTAIGSPVTVSNNTWTLTGVSGLAAGDVITATATASNKTISDVSASVVVATTTVPSCFTPAPVINSISNSGNITANVSWTPPSGFSFSANSVRILLHTQTGTNTFVHTFSSGAEFQYYPTSGTMTYNLGGNGNFTGTLLAEAIWNGCTSGFGNTVQLDKSSIITTNVTTAPTINTSPINVSATPQSIEVRNNHGANAVLTLYSNGTLIGTSTVVATNTNFTFTNISGLSAGDIITARAQGQGANDRISVISASITVGGGGQTAAPVITGSYTASSTIISGTSTEASGTTITVFRGGSPIGTTTVNAFGTWQLTGQTLVSGNQLTATAKATSKSTSVVSNTVTVQGTPPAAPNITGTYSAGATTISGGLALAGGTVRVFVDGGEVGSVATPSAGNWTVTVASTELYRGAVITARNVVSGVESVNSGSVTVTGMVSYEITNTSGSPIGTVI